MIASAKKLRCGRGVVFPVKFESVFSSGFEWKEDTLFLRGGMCFAQCFIFATDGAAIADILCKKRLHYSDGARSIGNVYTESAITRFNFDGSMFFAGCGSTNEEWYFHVCAFHFSGDGNHFIEGGSDESRKTDDLGSPFTGFFENGFPGNHHANVFDFEVVACEYNADNIFSDVMHIAFYGGKQDFSSRTCRTVFFIFHEGEQIGDGFFHNAGAFYHLRKKHFSSAKEISDGAHTIHKRSLNYIEWARVFFSGFFYVFIDVVDDPFD